MKRIQDGLVSLKPVRIALLYATLGLVWIFCSDHLMVGLFQNDPVQLLQVSSLKGFVFVLVTSLLLFVFLHRHVAAYRTKEQELRHSEERYRMVVENAPDAILIHDGARFAFANVEAAKLFGAASPEALIGREVLDVVHDDSKASVLERMRQGIAHKVPVSLREQRYLRLDGSFIEVEVSAVPLTMDGAAMTLVFMRDVGPRKAAQRGLRESEAKYRLLADNAHDLIFTMDPDMRLAYISPSVRKLRGISVEEALREEFSDSMTPESVSKMRQAVQSFHKDGRLVGNAVERLELEMRRAGGDTVWVESVVRPYLDAEGQLLGFVGVARDISERRQAEQELRRSRQFVSMILEAIPEPVFVKDSQHRFVLVNEALCAILGQTRENILGRKDEDFVPRSEATIFVERDTLVLETGREDLYEEQLTDSQGVVHVLVTRKGRIIDPRGDRFVVGVIRDVTEDKAQERRLRDSLLEKEVLLKEIHHRVKNNLQIISSLLFLQKDAIDDPDVQDMFEESRNRIASMAMVHEELYRSGDLARVDLKEYLERLAPKVVQSLKGRKTLGFKLDLAECRVCVDKAIPFGLIVNELVTNAVKHGFKGRDAGNIKVTVAREADTVLAEVEDDGVGLPAGFHPEEGRSLGMQLVVQLTRQLRGALSFGSGAEGTFFRLTFPLAAPDA